jgi:hypothetical protein
MVRELFGIAEPSAAVDDTQPAPAVLPPTASAPAEPPAAHRRVPVVPIVIAAAGVAFLAAGVGFGIAHESVDDKYASTKVTDIASARKADDAYDSSRARAMLADVSLGIGAAAVATGVVLFVVQWRDEPTEHAQLRTRLAATPTGLLFTRTWD